MVVTHPPHCEQIHVDWELAYRYNKMNATIKSYLVCVIYDLNNKILHNVTDIILLLSLFPPPQKSWSAGAQMNGNDFDTCIRVIHGI